MILRPEIEQVLNSLADRIRMRLLTGKEAMIIIKAIAELIRTGEAFTKSEMIK